MGAVQPPSGTLSSPLKSTPQRAMNRGVVFNGKFLSSRATGVHRVASELVRGVDGALSELASESGDWALYCPRDADQVLPLRHIEQHQVGRLTKQAWEQFEAPFHLGDRLLVGLCNMAPLATPGTITLIHDAHVFTTPESGSAAFNAWYRFALPRIGKRAAHVLTVSSYARDEIVRYGIAPYSKVTVIPNGGDHLLRVSTDLGLLEEFGLQRGSYVLAVANSQSHKNMRVLFAACSSFAQLGVRLVLTGPDDRKTFAAKGCPAPSEVVFTGYRSDAELRGLYENAICLAFPSTTEGFGLPPIEAMSLGCPVLAAPCGALPETCGKAAVFVDPRDPSAWAAAVSALIGGDHREQMASAGFENAERFRWRDSARQLLALINETRGPGAR